MQTARAPCIARASQTARVLCCSRLKNYAATNGLKTFSCTTFIVTPQGKSKSKQSNLLKNEEKANKQGEQIQNRNDVTLNEFRPFCGL